MNRGEMRTFLQALIGDPLGESPLWSATLLNELINDACQQTADWLPPEVLEVLIKNATAQNLVKDQAEYGIEGAGFTLTDYRRWHRIRVSDGTTMREAQVVSLDKLTSSNYLHQTTLYQPMVAIIVRTSDTGTRQRAMQISPAPPAAVTSGLQLMYIRKLPTMALDATVTQLPDEYHYIAMNHAAAYAYSKAKKADMVMANWVPWRERMISENARFGRVVEPPKGPST